MRSNKSLLANLALDFVPPLVRESLLEDKTFVDDLGIQLEPVLSIGTANASFTRSSFYEAIRETLTSQDVQEVFDISGNKWEIQQKAEKDGRVQVNLSSGDRLFTLPDVAALSPNVDVRLTAFDSAASDFYLPEASRRFWLSLLEKCSLHDDEFDALRDDFGDTPASIAQTIRSEIASGRMEKSSLVPHSRRYFDRLIGEYDDSTSLSEFVKGGFRKKLSQLINYRPYDGLSHAFVLSSHSLITDLIDTSSLGAEDIVQAYDFINQYGDVTSQLGAIEVGLRILPEYPEIQPALVQMVKQVRDDKVEESKSKFVLFSTLFILVYGDLSRTRLLSDTPPFYRRLAALSQAALIHRQLAGSNIDVEQFNKTVLEEHGELFYMQSYSDMRLEPRWYPDLIDPEQIKADFCGRIMIAAKKFEDSIKENELYGLILSENPDSVYSLNDELLPYLPGPLEGGIRQKNVLPGLAEIIEAQLSTGDLSPSSFFALVNSSLFFHTEKEQVDLAAKSLATANHRLQNIENRDQLIVMLQSLAITAGFSRSKTLSEELRLLTRKYRKDVQYALTVEEEMGICLISGASYEKHDEWIAFIGECMTELAFSDFDQKEGRALLSHIHSLCHIVPELWLSCGRADAALMAYNAINQ